VVVVVVVLIPAAAAGDELQVVEAFIRYGREQIPGHRVVLRSVVHTTVIGRTTEDCPPLLVPLVLKVLYSRVVVQSLGQAAQLTLENGPNFGSVRTKTNGGQPSDTPLMYVDEATGTYCRSPRLPQQIQQQQQQSSSTAWYYHQYRYAKITQNA
jgi:hypothetical protein